MLCRNVAQGVLCERIKDALRQAENSVKNMENQIVVLQDNIRTENHLLDSLLNQAERTGNHESFAHDIRQKEDKIRNLERQLSEVENEANTSRQKVDRLEIEMAQNGCRGFA